MIDTPWSIGSLVLPNRLIQGPLAGVSCSAFRHLFSSFRVPAYCVSEMLSSHDVVHKHLPTGRYLHRSPDETRLCYQIAGYDPMVMARAARILVDLGADLIDINCGCPKPKIRKKGAGSALMAAPAQLLKIVHVVRLAIDCPLTVKIRIQDDAENIRLVQSLEDAGVDAIIVHGRRWTDTYDTPCDLQHIASIKQAVKIPIIANGDIHDHGTLSYASQETQCDGFMISRAGMGQPNLFDVLLDGMPDVLTKPQRVAFFMRHLCALAALENDYQAVLQSKSWVKYYFRNQLNDDFLRAFYALSDIKSIENMLGVSQESYQDAFVL